MTFIPSLLAEFDNEMRTTRTLLACVPFDNAAWKPHDKSSGLGALASHLANIVSFGTSISTQPEVNFIGPDGKRIPQKTYTSSEELLAAFDEKVATAREAIAGVQDSALGETWSLRAGDHVIMAMPRAVALRTLLMNHLIHHRGQLSVYLRLNEVPLPSIYGPTADTAIM